MDSWRVKNVFKSNNGVSYEAVSSYMYKLSDHPKITKGISFECYPSAKRFLLYDGDPNGEIEVEVNDTQVATFKVEILRISKFIVGEPGEPCCKIPIKYLKLLLNSFATINARWRDHRAPHAARVPPIGVIHTSAVIYENHHVSCAPIGPF